MQLTNQQLTAREKDYCVNRLKGYRNEIKTLRNWEHRDKVKRPHRVPSLRAQRVNDIRRAVFYRGILRGTVELPLANLGHNRFITPAVPLGYTITQTRDGVWGWESATSPESHRKSGFDMYLVALMDCVRAQGPTYAAAAVSY
ncbi:hypothetical protein Illi2_00219 [Pseudomonas phage vB_PpuM-Illi-2]